MQLHELRLREIENAKAQKELELKELKAQYAKLRDDFEYNLRLLEDRDDELRRYDGLIEGLKGLLGEREAKIEALENELTLERNRTKQIGSEVSSREVALQEQLKTAELKIQELIQKHEFELAQKKADLEAIELKWKGELEASEKLRVQETAKLSAAYEAAKADNAVAKRLLQEAQERTEKASAARVANLEREINALRDALSRREQAAGALELALQEAERINKQRDAERELAIEQANAELRALRREAEEAKDASARALRETNEALETARARCVKLERALEKERKQATERTADFEAKLAKSAALRAKQLDEVRVELDRLRQRHRNECESLRQAAERTAAEASQKLADQRADAEKRYAQLEATYRETQEELWKRTGEVRTLKSSNELLERELGFLRGSEASLQAELKRLRDERVSVREKVEVDLERTRNQHEEQLRALQRDYDALQGKLAAVTAELAASRTAQDHMAHTTTRLQREVEMRQEELNRARADLDKAEKALRDAAEAAHEQQLRLFNERAAEQQRAEQKRLQIEDLTKQLDRAHEKIVGLEQQLESAEQRRVRETRELNERLQEALQNKSKEIEVLEDSYKDQLKDLREQIDVLTQRENEFEEARKELEASLEQSEARCRELEHALKAMEERAEAGRQMAITSATALQVAALAAKETVRQGSAVSASAANVPPLDLLSVREHLGATSARGADRADARPFSPAFSDDLGPVSPLPSLPNTARVRPTVDDKPLDGHEAAQTQQQQRDLERENETLRNIIASMRQDMEVLISQKLENQKAGAASASSTGTTPVAQGQHSDGPSQAEWNAVLEDRRRLSERVLVLSKELDQVKSQLHSRDTSGISINHDIPASGSQDIAQEISQLRNYCNKLEGELAKGHRELNRLVQERDRVMEISNRLRAELQVATRQLQLQAPLFLPPGQLAAQPLPDPDAAQERPPLQPVIGTSPGGQYPSENAATASPDTKVGESSTSKKSESKVLSRFRNVGMSERTTRSQREAAELLRQRQQQHQHLADAERNELLRKRNEALERIEGLRGRAIGRNQPPEDRGD